MARLAKEEARQRSTGDTLGRRRKDEDDFDPPCETAGPQYECVLAVKPRAEPGYARGSVREAMRAGPSR